MVAAFAARFPIKDLGRLEYYLGLHISVDSGSGAVTLDQHSYLHGLLERHDMLSCGPQRTPMAAPRSGDPALHAAADVAVDESGAQEYRAIVGGLLWMSICTRPDISYAVSQLARHMRVPAVPHLAAAKRVLRYLSGAQFGLQYTRHATPSPILQCYADAAFATDELTRKSTTGFVLMLEGAAVFWNSKLQSTVAASTTESEFIALFHASRAVDSLRALLAFVDAKQLAATDVFEDNSGALALSGNPMSQSLSRAIDVKYHYVREMVSTRVVNVVHTPTQIQRADVLTKALMAPKHVEHTQFISGASQFSE